MIRTLLVACFASAAGSGWVRRAHKRTQRNATRPQLQPVTSEDVSRYFAKNDLDGLCAALRDGGRLALAQTRALSLNIALTLTLSIALPHTLTLPVP